MADKPYRPGSILSENSKTGCSINMPIKGHCRPTKNCAATCYAKCGHTALPSNLRKQEWVSNYLRENSLPAELIGECRGKKAVRLSGTGDLSLEHAPAILRLARECPATQFWGMTRKLEVAKALNRKLPNLKLMVSVDSSSPESVWKYNGALCFGPRLKGDTVPADPRIITVFPYHRAGRVVKNMPTNPKDCQAVWHNISGCLECGRCWSWENGTTRAKATTARRGNSLQQINA